MHPTAYPVQSDKLLKYWQSFLETGKVGEAEGFPPDPIILRSWKRCAPLFDPLARPRPAILNERSLSSILKSHSDLISVSIPYMEDIYQFIEGSNSAILLLDGTACVLAVGGDTDAVRAINSYKLGQGRFWSEGYLGTNALGLAVITAMPTQVVGPEHYFQIFHHLVTSAAPIHDANGRIIGIIGIVSPVENATSHTLSLVMATARAITNQLQTNLFLEEANFRLTEMNTILESVSEGVLVWDQTHTISHVNRMASKILRLHPSSILGQVLTDVLKVPSIIAEAIEKNHALRDVEVTFELDGHEANVLINLSPVKKGKECSGCIALLRPIEQVRRLVHQQVGTKAMLTFDDISSLSSGMRSVLRQARIAARGTAPVLIRGEGGVGKTHLARTIHNASARADKPFITINCRAIPRELLVSEFLGQEKNTGQDGRPSKFELADGGTLLLDNIESLSLEAQAALVEVIETDHVMRIGGLRPMPVDVRIMATTTLNLERLVADGSFNSHLYYRFGVFNIAIPPLKMRTQDIPVLTERFLSRMQPNDEATPLTIDEQVLDILCRYPWPGNVREFEMVLERAVHLRQGSIIRVVDLPEQVRNGRVLTTDSPTPQPILSTAEAEREAIIRAGWACQGHVTAMAEQLGIGRTTLWRKMKRHHISPASFKQ